MPIRDQPDGDWEARLIVGAPCTGPMVLLKGCCFPCWGLGDLAAMRKLSIFVDSMKKKAAVTLVKNRLIRLSGFENLIFVKSHPCREKHYTKYWAPNIHFLSPCSSKSVTLNFRTLK